MSNILLAVTMKPHSLKRLAPLSIKSPLEIFAMSKAHLLILQDRDTHQSSTYATNFNINYLKHSPHRA